MVVEGYDDGMSLEWSGGILRPAAGQRMSCSKSCNVMTRAGEAREHGWSCLNAACCVVARNASGDVVFGNCGDGVGSRGRDKNVGCMGDKYANVDRYQVGGKL